MMKTVNDELYKEISEYQTPETRAFEYALDLSVSIYNAMKLQGITQKTLAGRMGVSPARLSQLLNMQPNLTLKTIARFEQALGINLLEVAQIKRNEDPILLDRGVSESEKERLKEAS